MLRPEASANTETPGRNMLRPYKIVLTRFVGCLFASGNLLLQCEPGRTVSGNHLLAAI